jgi:hypothetical protein
MTLEQIIEKEKKRNAILENNNIDKEILARQVPGKLS